MRSRPSISRPNLTHFTMCGACGAGCAEAAAPGFPEFFSSGMYVSLQSVLQFKILHRRRKFQLEGGQAAIPQSRQEVWETARIGHRCDPRQILAIVLACGKAGRGVFSIATDSAEKDSSVGLLRAQKESNRPKKDLFSGGRRCQASSGLGIDLRGDELSPEGLRLGAAQLRFDIACQESVEQVVSQEGPQGKG